jgi:S-adenosylmethionine hydrolase
MNSPMLVLFTDFGLHGPYVGQMKAVLAQSAPTLPVIDLLHDAPTFDARASAHLLAAYAPSFPAGTVFLCVVDPGVGDAQRKPVMVHIDGCWFVGPDNGLFDVVAGRGQVVQWWEISWRPDVLSPSFHGRDLFAPVAARLARGESPPGVKMPARKTDAEDYAVVLYIDHFGNAITGLRATHLGAKTKLKVGDHTLARARTFSAVALGQAFWYENANGLAEIAVNQGHAAQALGITIGDAVATPP